MMEYCAFYDGETRRGSDGNRRLRSFGNQGVGRFPGLCSFQRRPQPGRPPAAAIGAARAARGRHQPAVLGDHSLPEYDSFAAAAAVSRQPGDGTPHQEPGSLECAGHGGARQQNSGRHRRTYFDFRLRRHAVRSRLQSFLSRANRKRRPRCRLFPGTRRSRNLFPRLSRRPHSEREAAKLPSRTEARRRPEFLSPPVAHARLLGVSDRFDGTGSDSGDLSRALHQVSGESRTQAVDRRQGLGVSGRRRNGRTGIAGLDHAGLARKARQPDLRGELQPAAARRPGARQRKNHSGTGSDFPRRGMERHQMHLGLRLGQPDSERPRRPAGPALGRNQRRAISEIFCRERSVLPAEPIRQRSPPAEDGRTSFRRATGAHAAGRARSHQSSRRVPRRGRPHRSSRPSFSPRPSRATDWAKRAKARTSRTSRKN